MNTSQIHRAARMSRSFPGSPVFFKRQCLQVTWAFVPTQDIFAHHESCQQCYFARCRLISFDLESESESEVVPHSLGPHGLVAYQAPPSVGFSRQEYWSGVPFPSPGDLPDPGIKPGSTTLQADALTSKPPGKPSRYKSRLLFICIFKNYLIYTTLKL